MGNSPDIGSKKGFVVVKTRGGTIAFHYTLCTCTYIHVHTYIHMYVYTCMYTEYTLYTLHYTLGTYKTY